MIQAQEIELSRLVPNRGQIEGVPVQQDSAQDRRGYPDGQKCQDHPLIDGKGPPSDQGYQDDSGHSEDQYYIQILRTQYGKRSQGRS